MAKSLMKEVKSMKGKSCQRKNCKMENCVKEKHEWKTRNGKTGSGKTVSSLGLLTKKKRGKWAVAFSRKIRSSARKFWKFCAQPAKIQTSYDCADSASGRQNISNLPHQRDWSVEDWYTILTVFPCLIERKKGVDVILMRLCGDRRMSKNLWLITNCNSF